MSNYISQIINSKIDFLKSSYKKNKEVQHQGVKGNLNAILLHELIKDVIPTRYKFANGIIQDSKGFQSNESDLVIYDNDILPAVIFGGSLGFVPAEAVKYVFEVKSTLNSAELNTTINKFSNLTKSKGYRGVSSLFSFASDLLSKTELERYFEKEKEIFLKKPSIHVLMVVDRGYYFFASKKVLLKNLLSKSEFAKAASATNRVRLNVNEAFIDLAPGADISLKGDLLINGLNYDDLYVLIHRWYGIESNSSENNGFLAFLSGISNTLSRELFGEYLLADCKESVKIYSECVEDMWGNTSYSHTDFLGYEKTNLDKLSYSISLNEIGENNKIELYTQQ